MSYVNEAARKSWKRVAILLAVTALLVASAAPAYAWSGHRFHRRSAVIVVPHVVVPFAPFWAPYPYASVVVESPPLVYVQPSPPVYAQPSPPQPYWYYCDNPQGYYPHVQQCPGGWRQVVPTPQ